MLGVGLDIPSAATAGGGGFLSGATLDMIFTRNAYLGASPSSLTVTRASTAYADDTSGNWASFSSNVARITDKGLLIEEARTNSIRNNTMQGAAAGTPGTLPTNWSSSVVTSLTHSVIGSGTQNGIDYIDYIDFRVFGTPGATGTGSFQFDTNTGIAATTGQTFAQSVFVALVGGSLTGLAAGGIQLGGIERNSGGGLLLAFSLLQITPTATFTRFSTTRTIADATAAFYNPNIRYNTTNGVAVDFTIRIGWPQLELGAFATSPIPTTSAAVTRAADSISMTGSNFSSWFADTGIGTIYSEYLAVNGVVANSIFRIDNGTSNQSAIYHRVAAGLNNQFVVLDVAATVQCNVGAVVISPDTIVKVAGTYSPNDFAYSTGGGSVSTDVSGTTPTGMVRAGIGCVAGASAAGAYLIRRVAYFPSRLSNATLQAVTT